MYLTAAEAREVLRISRDTLTKLIKSGELKASKVGGSVNSPYRIDEDDLSAYLESKAVRASA
jgi:excisionase family DNA binding protein